MVAEAGWLSGQRTPGRADVGIRHVANASGVPIEGDTLRQVLGHLGIFG